LERTVTEIESGEIGEEDGIDEGASLLLVDLVEGFDWGWHWLRPCSGSSILALPPTFSVVLALCHASPRQLRDLQANNFNSAAAWDWDGAQRTGGFHHLE
jgi:hypothetical protein